MGTHPIFESDFDCLTEFRMLQRLAVQSLRQSVRQYSKPGLGNNNSGMQLYWSTGSHGPELYCLTAYCTIATGFLCYNLFYATAWKKNEMSLVPYINKDYNNMVSGRISWDDPRAMRTCTDLDVAKKFFTEADWKNDVKNLLAEIHE